MSGLFWPWPAVCNIVENAWASLQLNLLAVSEAICRKQPDWSGNHQICGFLNIPKPAENWTMPEDLMEFLNAGPPPVFISLGSVLDNDRSPMAIIETLVQGARAAKCRAIVQSRWDILPDFPDHPVIFKLRDASHQHIFPHCAAVVHHGGSGTTHSATLHGCPSIVIVHLGDQMLFALELQRLGVAPAPLHRRNITAKKLAKALVKVLGSPGMKNRAEELGAFMKKENGVKKAVGLIENRFAVQG
jgi:sterol 3beta-glucosyltransferase